MEDCLTEIVALHYFHGLIAEPCAGTDHLPIYQDVSINYSLFQRVFPDLSRVIPTRGLWPRMGDQPYRVVVGLDNESQPYRIVTVNAFHNRILPKSLIPTEEEKQELLTKLSKLGLLPSQTSTD